MRGIVERVVEVKKPNGHIRHYKQYIAIIKISRQGYLNGGLNRQELMPLLAQFHSLLHTLLKVLNIPTT